MVRHKTADEEGVKMKKYIVKSVSTATEENQSFKGEVHVYYHGKGDELIGTEGVEMLKRDLTNWSIKKYGYDRLCDARRCYSYKYPENTKYWRTSVEIVEVEI